MTQKKLSATARNNSLPAWPANSNGGTDLADNLAEDSYLYAYLELRYGAGYAQKLLDDLRRFERNIQVA
jgi:hypothetical protein